MLRTCDEKEYKIDGCRGECDDKDCEKQDCGEKEKDKDCGKVRCDHLHTHEYEGSVKVAEKQEDPHNHRFAGVTSHAILLSNGQHFHKLKGNTDFYENHFHVAAAETGPAIPVGDGRHVHFVTGMTTVNDGHQHEFEFAALIDNPIGG